MSPTPFPLLLHSGQADISTRPHTFFARLSLSSLAYIRSSLAPRNFPHAYKFICSPTYYLSSPTRFSSSSHIYLHAPAFIPTRPHLSPLARNQQRVLLFFHSAVSLSLTCVQSRMKKVPYLVQDRSVKMFQNINVDYSRRCEFKQNAGNNG